MNLPEKIYFPDVYAEQKYYNGSIQEEEYEKTLLVIIYVDLACLDLFCTIISC